MVRYIPITKFDGVNEKGLAYNEVIQKDVESLISTFLYCGSNTLDGNGEIEWMNIANVSNARFVLGVYYERELDLLLPENLAKESKKKIEDSIGLDQLLLKSTKIKKEIYKNMFTKIKRLISQYSLIFITLLIFTSMVFITSYLRIEYNKKPTVLSIVYKNPELATASIVNMAIQIDVNSSRSLYRKIWTYNAIIFLCGALLIYSIKSKKNVKA